MLTNDIEKIGGICCGYSIIKENGDYYKIHKIEITQADRDFVVAALNTNKASILASDIPSATEKARLTAIIDTQLANITQD